MDGEAAGAEGTAITVEVSAGELIDKITILQIKTERMSDARKLENVRTELKTLIAARDRIVMAAPELQDLTRQLKAANERLWEIEDEIRDCERRSDFGPRFVELARSVYRTNDDRCDMKRQVNQLLGSRLVEEKSYRKYQ